jgi:formylglycine-generating enzyme required for sulfatase activity
VPAGETLPEQRDLRNAFDLEALQETMARITYEKYARLATLPGQTELSTSELRAALINVGRDGRRDTVDALIARMRTRPTLLDEPRPDIHVYVHPCLQTHATAYHLANQPEMPQLAVSLAREDYARWREVILLAGERLAEARDDLLAALELADALCHPPAPVAGQRAVSDAQWRLAWLAGEILTHIAQEVEAPRPMQTLACVEEWLVALLSGGQLTPAERAKTGRVLDRLPEGDVRPGVSSPDLLWCPVPSGEFWRGEGQDAQIVNVSRFWISRYPVTNAQYAAFVRATGRPAPRHWQGEHPPPGIGNHPVVYVTWHDAAQYCTWYNERLFSTPFTLWRSNRVRRLDRAPGDVSRDWMVRLPASQEWEKAARGGLHIPDPTNSGEADAESTQDRLVDNPLPRRTYPWGDSWRLSAQGSRGDETRCNVSESDIGTTTPVGMYPDGASPYGVLDIAGNVWEWCLDWADEQNRYKVRRGGAFRFTHEHARCAAYDKAYPGLSWPHLGFRVVLAPSRH